MTQEVSHDEDLLFASCSVLQAACHVAARRAGWWQTPDGQSVKDNPLHFSAMCSLIHSEVSEAVEGDRKSLSDEHLPHRPAREVELADAVIRIMDLAGGYDLDVAGAIVEKLRFNAQRIDHKIVERRKQHGKTY
jgi:NTP pyrophosphatase (non-canonical NTP hydrolase)